MGIRERKGELWEREIGERVGSERYGRDGRDGRDESDMGREYPAATIL